MKFSYFKMSRPVDMVILCFLHARE